jgi:FKBP-type peptidyl-prolyl cis-trans isomerase (trigger factor)
MSNRAVPVALFAAVAIAVAALAYALHLGPWAGPAGPDPGPVIARVDGDPIHLAEARARVESLASVHGDIEQTLGKDWPERVMRSLVDDRVLVHAAADLGITVTDEDIAAHLQRVESLLPEGEGLDEWLASQGITRQELERRIRLQLIGARVYEAVTRDVTVSGAEIRAYYRNHRAEFEQVDGTVTPLLEVRRSLRETLLQQARDEAYAAWLRDARARAEVVVVMPDWWKRL